MVVADTVRVKRLKDKRSLETIGEGDLVELLGRNLPFRVHYNEPKIRIMCVYGRGKGDSIDWIDFDYDENSEHVEVVEGKLKMKMSPFAIASLENTDLERYEFYKNKLEEARAWVKE